MGDDEASFLREKIRELTEQNKVLLERDQLVRTKLVAALAFLDKMIDPGDGTEDPPVPWLDLMREVEDLRSLVTPTGGPTS